MPAKAYPHPEERRKARLEGRKTVGNFLPSLDPVPMVAITGLDPVIHAFSVLTNTASRLDVGAVKKYTSALS